MDVIDSHKPKGTLNSDIKLMQVILFTKAISNGLPHKKKNISIVKFFKKTRLPTKKK
jgi:hypothetical protein